MIAMLNSLTDTEQALVRETESARMEDLDEDDMIALHGRVRRARNKYIGLYRREASARVPAVGARGKARPRNRRNYERAEVFEDALARVSRRLAAVARQSAAVLKAERLAAARQEPVTAPAASNRSRAAIAARSVQSPRPARAAGPRPSTAQTSDRAPRTPDRLKRHATARASTARRQAKRDNR